MGDRGNIIVMSGNSKVFLYTHYDGSVLPEIIKKALIRGKNRWDDGQYLARILFCEMVKDDIMGLTGYGITSELCDGGTDITVNVDTQTVSGISFDEYIQGKKVKTVKTSDFKTELRNILSDYDCETKMLEKIEDLLEGI